MTRNIRLANSNNSYGLFSILIHWVSAILTIGLMAMGLYMVGLNYYDPWYHRLPGIHKYLGIWLIFISLVRLLLSLCQPRPSLPLRHAWEKIAAKTAHTLLIIFLWACLISGYLIAADGENPFHWHTLNLPKLQLPIENQADKAGLWHEYLAYTLCGLITLHVLATIKHLIWDKQNLLKRILKP